MMNIFVLVENQEQVSVAQTLETDAATEFSPVEPDNTGEAPRCRACGGFTGSLSWLPPLRVELVARGRSFGDVAYGPGDDVLVSERFALLFKRAGLSGLYGFDPVEIVKIKGARRRQSEMPNYLRVHIVRSNAAVDIDKSRLVVEGGPPCQACRLSDGIKRAERIVIEDGTWSGEDIFRARGLPGKILTTDKFKGFCEANHVLNAILVPGEVASFDHYPLE